ncbi:MAG: hypothetical protein ACMUHB_06465 [Thermoplasmatota archaeon]
MKGMICLVTVFGLLLSITTFPIVISQTTGAVPVGEPLHLYLRRSPVQDRTYLYFHPPGDGYQNESKDDIAYRETLTRKGTETDHFFMRYPEAIGSNFLQFEPNGTLKMTYSFTISSVKPPDISDIRYTLGIIIELDYDHDGKWDRDIAFEITGDADNNRYTKEGEVDVDVGSLKRFDGEKGGRIQVTLSRLDDIDTTLTIYCGYLGYHSHFQLPYSKYRYEQEQDGPSRAWVWVVVGGVAVIGAFIVYVIYSGRKKKTPPQSRERNPRRRGRR